MLRARPEDRVKVAPNAPARRSSGEGTAKAAALTLTAAFAVFTVHDYLSLRQRLARDLAIAAEGLAISLAPFVERGDLQSAAAVLRSVAARPDVLQAGLLGPDGQPRNGRYAREGVDIAPPAPEPSGPPRFVGSRLRVFTGIVDGAGRPLGTLFVETTTEELRRRSFAVAGLGASIALLGLLLAALVGRPRATVGAVASEPGNEPARPAPPALVSAPARAPGTSAPARADGAVQTVLVIDDDDDTRELLARGLAREGFHVVTAADWEQGLRRAREVRPDLITLDALMPDTDGWAVLRALKEDAEIAQIPVVMTTLVSDRAGAEGRRLDYLLKPLDPERLAAIVGPHVAAGSEASVLVVGGDQALRWQLRAALPPRGWLVLEAESADAALQLMAGALPDVVLIDFDGEDRPGVEFLEALRGQATWSEIPVVVLSASELGPEERAAIEAPAPRVFQKSALSSHELARQIRGLLDGGRERTARRAGAS